METGALSYNHVSDNKGLIQILPSIMNVSHGEHFLKLPEASCFCDEVCMKLPGYKEGKNFNITSIALYIIIIEF